MLFTVHDNVYTAYSEPYQVLLWIACDAERDTGAKVQRNSQQVELGKWLVLPSSHSNLLLHIFLISFNFLIFVSYIMKY